MLNILLLYYLNISLQLKQILCTLKDYGALKPFHIKEKKGKKSILVKVISTAKDQEYILINMSLKKGVSDL